MFFARPSFCIFRWCDTTPKSSQNKKSAVKNLGNSVHTSVFGGLPPYGIVQNVHSNVSRFFYRNISFFITQPMYNMRHFQETCFTILSQKQKQGMFFYDVTLRHRLQTLHSFYLQFVASLKQKSFLYQDLYI